MSGGKLYIHFDTFYPSAYKPNQPVDGAETYESERRYIYVVANAYWLPPEEDGDPGGLADYFQWTGAKLDEHGQVVLLDENVFTTMDVASQQRMVPVPFPPMTDLRFGATWAPQYSGIGSVIVSGALGRYTVAPSDPDPTDPLQLPADMWPVFAVANFSVPTAQRWMDMTPPQWTDVIEWCCAIIPRLNEKSDQLTGFEKKAYELYKEDAVLNPPQESVPEARDIRDPNSDDVLHRQWREKLRPKDWDEQTDDVPLAGLIFETLVGGGSMLKFVGTAPKFLVDPAKLANRPELVLSNAFLEGSHDAGKELTGMSYHRRLWESMKAIVGKPFAEGEAEDIREGRIKGEQTASQALGQLFGYGERLRWKKPSQPEGAARFMVPQEKSERIANLTSKGGPLHHIASGPQKKIDDWFGTNAHSLLGQVFRIGPLADDPESGELKVDELHVTELSVGAGIDLAAARTQLAGVLRDHINDANEALSQTFAVRLERDRDNPNGLVFYAPKMALGAPSKLTSPDGGLIFEPPGVLLDSVDPTPRVDMPAAKDPKTFGQKNNLLIFNPARTAFRSSELYRPKILTDDYCHYFRVKLEVNKELLPYADETVLRLTLQNKLEPEEWSFIAPIFESLAKPGSDPYWTQRAPAVWVAIDLAEGPGEGVAKTEREFFEAGAVLSMVSTKDLHGRNEKIELLLRDPDDRIMSCLKRAANAANKRGKEDLRCYLAEFVVNVSFDVDGEYANLWQWTGANPTDTLPLFMLNGAFTSRVSRSVERLTERFQTTLSPSPWAIGNVGERIDDHFGNFNKLRLALLDPTVDGAKPKFLNYPDALANLITQAEAQSQYPGELVRSIDWAEPPKPNGPHYTYLVPHIFAQEIGEDPMENEKMRFEGYRDAGRVWQLTGNVEHQYSYRFPFIAGNGGDDDGTLRLQLTTDIRHPSELSRRGVEGVVDDYNERKQSKELRNLIAFDHRPGSPAEDELISIFFPRNALRTMLRAYDNAEQNNSKGAVRPAQLRELYESLLDFRFALRAQSGDTDLTAGDLTLLLERWNFDNDNPVVSEAEIFGLSPYPSISANMLCVETGTLSLRQLKDMSKTALDTLDTLLDGTFKNFVDTLRSHAALPDLPEFKNDAPWLQLDIPIDRSDTTPWKWEGQSTASLYEDTNAIRVGLTIKRPAWAVADDTYGKGSFFGMTSYQTDISRAPALQGESFENDGLRERAKAELAEYFDRDAAELSPLHSKFMWLPSLDIDPKSNPVMPVDSPSDPDKYDPQRYKRLFGEVLPVLNFPTGSRRDVREVVNVYYVPHAFIPLQAHPSMREAKTTTEFAQFLVRAIGEIASSTLPSEIGLVDEVIDPATALLLRTTCRELLEDDGGIADSIAKLVTFVDDRATISQSWDDPNIDPDTLTRRQAEKILFNQVYKILDDRDTLIKGTLRAMLTREPNLFESAKGFGIGLFDDVTFSERLYDIQLRKEIRRINSGGANMMVGPTQDTDRMSFAQFLGEGRERFFIDVLDDKSYDNEFKIDQNTYETRVSYDDEWQDVDHSQADRDGRRVEIVRDLTRIKTRGGALGRTAEDHIEQDHQFKTANDQVPRNVELNVVHYNPEWRIRDEKNNVSDLLYILPSRWLPPMPVTLQPKQDSGSDSNGGVNDDKSLWRSVIMRDWAKPPTGHLEKEFENEAKRVLDRKAEVSLPSTGNDGGKRKATRLEESIQIADGKDAEGWHHIESYLSHYYFIIDADEEGRGADPLFSNDAIEIFTEVADKPFKKTPRDIKSEHAKPVSELHKWFLYSRRLKHGTSETLSNDEQQKDMKLADVVRELKLWIKDFASPDAFPFTEGLSLLRGRTKASAENRGSLNDITDDGDRYATWSRYWFSGGAWKLEHKQSEGGPDNDIGNVVAAEIFTFDDQDPKDANQQYVLRVTVLDEPWKFTRARIRVRRNFRDVDGNNDPDINPIFVLTSPLSEWSDYGLQPLEIGPADFKYWSIPEEVSRLLVVPDAQNGVPSLNQWYNANMSDVKSFGPLVRTATIDTKFTVQQSGCTKTYNYWNIYEMSKAVREVGGTVEYPVKQRSLRVGTNGGLMGGVDELEWNVARQFLNPVDGATLENLATVIKKSETPGTELIMRVTWNMGGQDEPILTVTWPVKFVQN
ncbi:hypothetical protein [Rheinheimera gaetbuli]